MDDLKLMKKDGNLHTIVIDCYSKFSFLLTSVNSRLTESINNITSEIQSKGYEIVDIKFSAISGSNGFKNSDGVHVFIMYK